MFKDKDVICFFGGQYHCKRTVDGRGVAGAFRNYPQMLDTKEIIMEEIIKLTI